MTKASRIVKLQEALEEAEAAKRNLVANGQAYQIQGSHSRTSASFKELTRQENSIKKQILRARGVNKRYNYSGIGNGDTV